MGIASSYCMNTSDRIEVIRHKYELLRPLMTERMRRQWAACEAMSFPRGGFTLVAHDLVGRQARTATPGRAATGGHSTGTGSTARWGTAFSRGERSDPAFRLAGLTGVLDPRGSPVAVTLDVQEHSELCRGTHPGWSSRHLSDGGGLAARPGLQLASQSQDQGRGFA